MDQYPDPAASWLLVRAFGDLQCARDCAPITDMDALACAARLLFSQLPRLIATSIVAGWIEEGDDGALGLTAEGWRRYRQETGRPG